MDDIVSFQFTQVKQNDSHRDQISFELKIRQQPEHSRMCGIGEKADRRPIDPPPIIQLEVFDPTLPGNRRQFLHNPYYFMYTTLISANGMEELSILPDRKARAITGSSVSSLSFLKDDTGKDGAFFVFPDLSVRCEGVYKLKFLLFEIVGIRGDRNRQLNLIPDNNEKYYRKQSYETSNHSNYTPVSAPENFSNHPDYDRFHGQTPDNSQYNPHFSYRNSRPYDIYANNHFLPNRKTLPGGKKSSIHDTQNHYLAYDSKNDSHRRSHTSPNRDPDHNNPRFTRDIGNQHLFKGDNYDQYHNYHNSKKDDFIPARDLKMSEKEYLSYHRNQNANQRDYNRPPRDIPKLQLAGIPSNINFTNKRMSSNDVGFYDRNKEPYTDDYRQPGAFYNPSYPRDIKSDRNLPESNESNSPLSQRTRIPESIKFGQTHLELNNPIYYRNTPKTRNINSSPQLHKSHFISDQKPVPPTGFIDRLNHLEAPDSTTSVVIRDSSNKYSYNEKKFSAGSSVHRINDEYPRDLRFYNTHTVATDIPPLHAMKRKSTNNADYRFPESEMYPRANEYDSIDASNKRSGFNHSGYDMSSRSESPKARRITVSDLLINENSNNSSPI
ncbi:hypothetical protein AYI70_g259 [Smittium culicis]|uniref:Velvet domain-containing protein n=1 Tax=Smittium culicis TaxID=133412 RepID=A0A1R1YHG9_9FUNG|nr:hypothetical protein AYI70_g259 [Smittium culicis]